MMQRHEALKGQWSIPHENILDASLENKTTTTQVEEILGKGRQESGVNA